MTAEEFTMKAGRFYDENYHPLRELFKFLMSVAIFALVLALALWSRTAQAKSRWIIVQWKGTGYTVKVPETGCVELFKGGITVDSEGVVEYHGPYDLSAPQEAPELITYTNHLGEVSTNDLADVRMAAHLKHRKVMERLEAERIAKGLPPRPERPKTARFSREPDKEIVESREWTTPKSDKERGYASPLGDTPFRPAGARRRSLDVHGRTARRRGTRRNEPND